MTNLYEQVHLVLHGLWRRRWIGLAVAWAVCAIGWIAIALVPNAYQSNARIYVQIRSLLPEKLGIDSSQKQRDIDVVRQTLTSGPNLEKVVRRTDLGLRATTDEDIAKLANELLENISINSQQDDLFSLTYTARIPGLSDAQNASLARAVVQNLINIFVEDNLAGDRESLSQSLRFLDDQLASREKELEEAEARRSAFEQKYLGALPGEGSVTQRLEKARDDLDQVEQGLIQAQSSLRALSGQLGSTNPTIAAPLFTIGGLGGGNTVDAGSIEGRIAGLEASISDARSRGATDNHPDVVAARRQIDRLRSQAANEPRTGRGEVAAAQANPVYVNLRSLMFDRQSQVAALTARRAQLQAAIGNLQKAQMLEPGIAAEGQRINRDYDVKKRQYDELLAHREEVRLQADVESNTESVKFQVIDPPGIPREPVAPNRPLLLSLVLIAGLGAGVAAAFVFGQLHRTFASTEQLQAAIGLPVLGGIAEVMTAPRQLARRTGLMWFGGLTASLLAGFVLLVAFELWQHGSVA